MAVSQCYDDYRCICGIPTQRLGTFTICFNDIVLNIYIYVCILCYYYYHYYHYYVYYYQYYYCYYHYYFPILIIIIIFFYFNYYYIYIYILYIYYPPCHFLHRMGGVGVPIGHHSVESRAGNGVEHAIL